MSIPTERSSRSHLRIYPSLAMATLLSCAPATRKALELAQLGHYSAGGSSVWLRERPQLRHFGLRILELRRRVDHVADAGLLPHYPAGRHLDWLHLELLHSGADTITRARPQPARKFGHTPGRARPLRPCRRARLLIMRTQDVAGACGAVTPPWRARPGAPGCAGSPWCLSAAARAWANRRTARPSCRAAPWRRVPARG